MSVNKYKPHLYVVPEDDAERQIADGFVLHSYVDTRQVQVVDPAGGWTKVIETFKAEYLTVLQQNDKAHVVLLVDFDMKGEDRLDRFKEVIPSDFCRRVFVIGPSDEPESLRRATNQRYEEIGLALAKDCYDNETDMWGHPQLRHNDDQLKLLEEIVKPFLFC